MHQRPSPVHPTPSPTPRTCIQMSVPYLCVSAPALHILFSSSFTFTSSCFFFFTVGVGRLNPGPVSQNLLLTWQNPELCSFPSPRVSQRNSLPVACGTPCWVMHLLSAFFSLPGSYLHSYWSFFEWTPKFTYNNWILNSACFWGDLDVYFPRYFSVSLI